MYFVPVHEMETTKVIYNNEKTELPDASYFSGRTITTNFCTLPEITPRSTLATIGKDKCCE